MMRGGNLPIDEAIIGAGWAAYAQGRMATGTQRANVAAAGAAYRPQHVINMRYLWTRSTTFKCFKPINDKI